MSARCRLQRRVRFLVDNALSPRFVDHLRSAHHDGGHVRDYALAAATDSEILIRGAAENRIIVSADTDCGTPLALRQQALPSFILFRDDSLRPSDPHAGIFLEVRGI